MSSTVTESNVDISNIELSQVSKGTNQPNFLYSNLVYKQPGKSKGGPFRILLENLNVATDNRFNEEYKTYSCIVNLSQEQFDLLSEITDHVAELGIPMFKEASKSKQLSTASLQTTLKPKNDDYDNALSFKFKFNATDNKFWCKLIDNSRKPLDFTTENPGQFLKRGSLINCQLSASVYKTGANYGVSWKPVAIQVVKVGEDSGSSVDCFPVVQGQEEEREEESPFRVHNSVDEVDDEADEDDDEVANVLNSKSSTGSRRVGGGGRKG